MPVRISVGLASEAKIASFMKLTETYYQGRPINEVAVVRWRHLDAPAGPSTTVELVDKDESVGRMWIRLHPWSVHGKPVRAVNPCDFLIREDHRRLPAFMSLFKATMNESQQMGELVYHTSNPLTDDLYRKLMKLKPVAELSGALIPIQPFGAAQAAGVLKTGSFGKVADAVLSALVKTAAWLMKIGSVRLSEPPSIDEQERVIAKFVSEEQVCGARTAEHRRWRHRGAGPIVYQEHWVTKHERAIGYLVTTDRDVEGVRACFIVDIVLPGHPSRLAIWSIWLQIASLASKRDRQVVFFLYNGANKTLARLASMPMVKLPKEKLPQQVPVFVKPSKGIDPSTFDGIDFARGYFVLSDFDMF